MGKGRQKSGYLFTLLGAATGLGNALRFPGLCLKNGGGAFVLAYAVALVTVCYPLVCAELSLGRAGGGSFPRRLGKLYRHGGRVGAAACANSALIALYYGAIISRLALSAADIYPVMTAGVRVVPRFLLPLLACGVWGLMFLILRGGVGALEKTSRFTVVISLSLFALFAVRGIGCNGFEWAGALFLPDFKTLLCGSVWADAFGQALLALSLAAGVIPALSENMPLSSSVPACAAKILATNFAGCVLTSAALFSALYAPSAPVLITENGFTTAFTAYPAAILRAFPKPAAAGTFGVAFYLCLAAVAVQSALSLSGAAVSALAAKFNSRSKAAAVLCLAGAVFSPLFALFPALLEGCDELACTVNAFTVAFFESVALSRGQSCGFRLKVACPAVFAVLSFLSVSGGAGAAAFLCACSFAFFPTQSANAFKKILRGFKKIKPRSGFKVKPERGS